MRKRLHIAFLTSGISTIIAFGCFSISIFFPESNSTLKQLLLVTISVLGGCWTGSFLLILANEVLFDFFGKLRRKSRKKKRE